MIKKLVKKPVKKTVQKILVKTKKISGKKQYIPNSKEKYMCPKHKQFFKEELFRWKNDRKLIEKIESALRRIKDGTYGYCDETSEPIGLKRLIARPVATLSIEAQERHERDEKIFIED